jgi:hypothetical protein
MGETWEAVRRRDHGLEQRVAIKLASRNLLAYRNDRLGGFMPVIIDTLTDCSAVLVSNIDGAAGLAGQLDVAFMDYAETHL